MAFGLAGVSELVYAHLDYSPSQSGQGQVIYARTRNFTGNFSSLAACPKRLPSFKLGMSEFTDVFI